MIKTTITSRHFKARESLNEYIKEKAEFLSKFNEEILHVDVILDFEKNVNSIKNCEIIAKVNNKIFTSKESSEDFYKSVDLAFEKIEVQLSKYKDKMKKEKYSDTEKVKTI